MSRPGSVDRQAQRKQRLIEAEKEQLMEDQEALRMTEDQRDSLLTSFASVKTQFFDLDGLRWTSSALKKRAHISQPLPRRPLSTVSDDTEPLSPVTNTSSPGNDESWEDTIRPGGELSALLTAYYSADSKIRPPRRIDKPNHILSHDQPAPKYISYSKVLPNATLNDSAPPTPTPSALEQPTPRPLPVPLAADPEAPPSPSPSPQPSLKRRLSITETPTNEPKRAHRLPRIAV